MIPKLITLKKTLPPLLKKHGVKKAAIFGSVARGDATATSDIDLLVEFRGKKTLFDLAGLRIELEERLKKKIDLVTYRSLHPLLKERILNEQKIIYGKGS